MVNCFLCKREFISFQSLGKHISGTHKVKLEDYYLKFLGSVEESFCKLCHSKCSFINISIGYLKYCSPDCATKDPDRTILIKDTSIKKYGTESPNQSKIVKEKKIITSRKNYGVDNVFKSEEIKKKICETNQQNFGVDNPLKSEFIKNKLFNTNLKRYGYTCSLLNKKVREKSIKTLLQRYGVDNYAKTDIGRKKQ